MILTFSWYVPQSSDVFVMIIKNHISLYIVIIGYISNFIIMNPVRRQRQGKLGDSKEFLESEKAIVAFG